MNPTTTSPATATEIPTSTPVFASPTATTPPCTTTNTTATTNNDTPPNTTTPDTDTITPAETEPTTPLVKVPAAVDPVPVTPVDRHTTTMGHKTRKGILYTTAFLFPPLAVYFRRGTNKDFGLNILLTILGWYVLTPCQPVLKGFAWSECS